MTSLRVMTSQRWIMLGHKKKIYVFPIAWSSKLGSVGLDFFVFLVLKPTSMLLPLKSHKLVSFFLTTAYSLFDMQYNVFGSKHRSNVQGNEENSNRKPVFDKSVSIKRLSESVKSQQSSIYCWNQKQTRKRGRISRFCRSIFFLA